MTVTQITPGLTADGTAAVLVPQSRCYTVIATWDEIGTQPLITMQVSADGAAYFPLQAATASPQSQNWSQTGSAWIWRLIDLPVAGVQITVSGLSTGTIVANVVTA